MRYKRLGRTAVDVGVVGLGAEYLERAPRDTVISVVDVAIDEGINYIDLFMASPDVRDNFGIALRNRRHKVMVAGHIGSGFGNDQYYRTRDTKECRQFFIDLLQRLQTDYIDVLMLHYVDLVREDFLSLGKYFKRKEKFVLLA
jgi:aryl-alcohol dehydrogenase-like predicted oxidoreductase